MFILKIEIKWNYSKARTRDTNFSKVFKNIDKFHYKGNLILQTARSNNDEHSKELEINLAFIKDTIFKLQTKSR